MAGSDALNPIDSPQDWDVLQIGNQKAPGLWKLSEAKRKHEWDVKRGKGVRGSTITFVGEPPASFSATGQFWLPEHFTQWATFRQLLRYDPTKKAIQAIDIFHPSLADIEIKSVVTESIGNIIHKGEQLYEVVVEFIEYWPPPKQKAVSTPTGSLANTPLSNNQGAPLTGPTPMDQKIAAREHELALLGQQARLF